MSTFKEAVEASHRALTPRERAVLQQRFKDVKLVTVKVKKGCGQRKNKRDAAGRAKHREVVRVMQGRAPKHKQ